MDDNKTTVQELKNLTIKMAQERDWEQFHSPKNLAMDIAIEAAELMELFLWCTTEESAEDVQRQRTDVEHELADILIATFLFAYRANIDIAQAIKNKLAIIEQRYPVHLAKGKSTKYTKLHEPTSECK